MRQCNLSSKKIAEQKIFFLVKTFPKLPYTLLPASCKFMATEFVTGSRVACKIIMLQSFLENLLVSVEFLSLQNKLQQICPLGPGKEQKATFLRKDCPTHFQMLLLKSNRDDAHNNI